LNSGVPYVSLHEITGLTVEPKNIIQLKAAIEKIIYSKDLYESYSKNAIKRAHLFSIDHMILNYMSHF
jgi:rhamnosyl/mannosyltransferase